jgi:hypothetical protein
MNTERLIDTLARDLTPAPPLSRPWVRSAWWLLGAGAYLSVLTLMMASPAEVAANGRGWAFAFQVAAILTAATAAGAAFASTVPGSPCRIFLLPGLAAMIWVGSLAARAVQEWSRGGVSLTAPGEWPCVAMIVFGSALPVLAMTIMLRRGAPLTPDLTAGLAMLATTSLASVSACLSHPHPSAAVILVWHGITILALVAMAARAGRGVLKWNTSAAFPARER